MTTVQNANFIQYGRRKGETKSVVDKKEQINGSQLYLPNESDLRQVKVLRREEFNRINDQLYAKERERRLFAEKQLEKQRLLTESKELVKNWPNTLIGERQKKLQAKKLREKEEEKQRALNDIEEEKFQAQRRKEAIEKAKTKQYFQSDRVKCFHSAFLLTEVLKERDLQVILNKAKKEAYKDPDEAKRLREAFEKSVIEEQEKERLKRNERCLLSKYQIDQIKEKEEKCKKLHKEEQIEGERIRSLAKLHKMEEEQLKKVKRSQQNEIMNGFKKQFELKKKIEELVEERNEEENEEIRIFSEGKRHLQKIKKEKQCQKFKEAERRREDMRMRLEEFYKSQLHNENEVLLTAVYDKEKKDKLDAERLEASKKEALKSIKEFRLAAIKLHKEQEKNQKMEDRESLRLRIAADEKSRFEDREKRKENLRRAQNVQKFQVAQINERAEEERQNIDFDVIAENRLLEASKFEEKRFNEYTKEVIEHAKANGRNIYPLVKAAREGFGNGHGPVFQEKGGVRPSYMSCDKYAEELPCYNKASAVEMKTLNDGGVACNAKKRLGFVWK